MRTMFEAFYRFERTPFCIDNPTSELYQSSTLEETLYARSRSSTAEMQETTPQGDRTDERAPQETACGLRRQGTPSRQGNDRGSEVPPELQDGCREPHGAYLGWTGGTVGQASASILHSYQAEDRHAMQNAAAGPRLDGHLYQTPSGLRLERA